jgi:hypothetical protein
VYLQAHDLIPLALQVLSQEEGVDGAHLMLTTCPHQDMMICLCELIQILVVIEVYFKLPG